MSIFSAELKRRINEYFPSLGDRPPGLGPGGLLGLIESKVGPDGWFSSVEQTGTGSAQNIAHGLGRTPSVVIVSVSDNAAGNGVWSPGTHTDANVVITAASGVKYYVWAF